MGNSPTSSKFANSSIQNSSNNQAQNVLLVKANENSSHFHVSKYQHYHDNELLSCFEFLRWKLNIALLFRPFLCLSQCDCCTCCCCFNLCQFLYRLTISELLFWSICITLSIFPITWFLDTLHTDPPIFKYSTDDVISSHKDENGNYFNSPGNKYGVATSICFVLVFALSLRNTLWNLIFGLSIERAIFIHKYLGRLSMVLAFIHFWQYRNFAWFKGQCLTGSITFLTSVAITLTSLGIFRRKIWTIFMKVHWLLFLTFLVSGLLHHAKYLWIAVGLVGMDLFYRMYLIRQKPVKVIDVKLLPCNVIRIEFDKRDFQFEAGQYVFICYVSFIIICIKISLYTFNPICPYFPAVSPYFFSLF